MDIKKAGMCILMLLVTVGPANADNQRALLNGSRLAFSRLLTNDYIGDRKDRWRTFSYAVSVLKPFEDKSVGELRFRTEIIAGRKLKLASGQDPDRRMAGVLGIGAYRSAVIGKSDYRIGVELTAIGPQTGLVNLQERVHEKLNQSGPSAYAKELQVGDRILLGFNGETGRDFIVGQTAVRPWVAVEGGAEAFARVGMDFTLGHTVGNYGIRDELTGWRLPILQNRNTHGISLIAGFDIAHVVNSVYIEEGDLTQNRLRLRAGGLVDFKSGRIFYGATYLSEEFKNQPENQVVGSVTISMFF
ncbi:DUF2219 family protein [Paracoccus aestuarii]|uniref:DUF2219 family protein n=1 Tax=Paracoccus aestuarii TaxID=453842 RepID=A0A418ZQ36_9RHOB|nr:lipid A-modifier LpxR family protein [Paracoccus aestuarii]RJK96225.1 DUF2219 family protein [Paracoccus aestuarii]